MLKFGRVDGAYDMNVFHRVIGQIKIEKNPKNNPI